MERKAFIFHSFGDIHVQALSEIFNCEKKILEVEKYNKKNKEGKCKFKYINKGEHGGNSVTM